MVHPYYKRKKKSAFIKGKKTMAEDILRDHPLDEKLATTPHRLLVGEAMAG